MNAEKRKQLLIYGAIAVVGIYLGDQVVIRPLTNWWKSQGEETAMLRKNLADGKTMMDRKSQLEEREAEMHSRSLPAATADAESALLGAVGQWTATDNLQVDSISPRWLLSEKDGNRLEVNLSAKGDIESVTRFLHSLETNDLPVRLENVELRPRDDKGQEISLDARFSGIVLPGTKS
ncbi:hypothetical protein BH09SUM1_BH09SUM1_14890 [soil metagenome]